ncbi:MAG: Crp/Fnr family transcriptional regulator [Crocinitomix sp.]|nr:Crp/Fnr family transcriptional regulator [Crocinitomix sp.]
MEDHFLNKIFKAENYSTDDFQKIIQSYQEIHIKKGDYFLREGKVANHYWFIQSGLVRSYAIDPSGKDISTNFYAGGDLLIDWPSFFMRQPIRENIQAITDCACWQLDFNTFQNLFHSIEAFREQGRANLVKSYFTLKNHTISIIADQAKERYLKLIKEKPELSQNVSLKHLASYLGITDTSLSRIRKEIALEK